MYGYDNKGGAALNLAFGHEGEWERVIVRLNANDEATGVDYYQHNCSAEHYAWDQMRANGYLVDETHPIVYAAKGGHASYPKKTKYPRDGYGSCPVGVPSSTDDLQGATDDATGGGETWRTWLDVRPIEQEPWYGYGGGWGEVVASPKAVDAFCALPLARLACPTAKSIATGPMGPPHLDPSG
jgi:hypothetical protein